MRPLGAVLIVLAGVLMGLQRAAELRRTVQTRAALCRMLEGLAYELGRFRTPLPEVFSTLCAQSEGAALSLCRAISERMNGEQAAFSAVWMEAISLLSPREREILAPLGSVLGRYGAEEQLPALERCLREMEELLSEGRERLRERSGVCVGLWAAAGLMAAVVLI